VTLALVCLAVCGCSSDLFHSTAWPTACDYDPSTPGCPAPAPDAAEDQQDAAQDSAGNDAQDDG
jgi:hypothetical protein